MKVKRRMTPNPVTGTPDMSLRAAMQVFKTHGIRHLPVLDAAGDLVGLVSRSDLLNTGPASISTLSVFEIYTLLDEVTVDQVMSKPVLAVEEDCSLPAAAHYMIENGVGCLPVLRDGRLVGIITETDIFRVFVEVMGGGEPGSRVEIQFADTTGQMAAAMAAFTAAGSYIISVTSFRDEEGAYTIASVKERGADEARLREELARTGTIEILDYRPSGHNRLLRVGG